MIGVAGLVAFIVLDSPLGVAALVGGLLIEVGELYFWTRFLRRYRVQTGAEGLIGKRGEALGSLGAGGRVRVHGEIWSATLVDGAPDPGPGAEVVVREVSGLKLRVEPTGAQLR